MQSYDREASEAVKIALQTETDGLEMYERAGQRTSYPLGKKMLLSLAEDERSHIRMIERIVQGVGLSAALKEARHGTPRERVRTIFSEAKDEVTERLAASADDVKILKTALEFENRGYSFYQQAARDASREDERALFERLAQEESEHYKMLQNTYEYLERTGQWFLWEEQGILNGG